MKAPDLQTHLTNLLREAEQATKVAQTAEKNRHALNGHSSYADRFHSRIVALTGIEKKVRPHLDSLSIPASELAVFDQQLVYLKDTATKAKARVSAVRNLRMVCETSIIPKVETMTASPIPSTELVLPMEVVRGTRGYLEKMVMQINGCYEHQWYDASSVMIRKLAESLIILVYEHKGVAAEIKGADGNFLTLSALIDHIKTKKAAWNLSRDVGPCLDKMKELGDHSAHNRYYMATKPDVDKLLSGLRVTVEELLHQAGLK